MRMSHNLLGEERKVFEENWFSNSITADNFVSMLIHKVPNTTHGASVST